MHVIEVSNGTSVAQNKSGSVAATTTPSLVLDATPATTSLVIAGIAHVSAATAPTANFTELSENNGNRGMQSQYDAGTASATVDWTTGSAAHVMAAIEVT